jgi:hypothetical protein
MSNQIKIVLDLLAGILAGMELLVPKTTYKKFDNYLLGGLQDTITRKGSVRWIWIFVAIIVVIGIFGALTFSAFSTDIRNGRIIESVFVILGFLAGMIVLALVARFYRVINSLQKKNPMQLTFGVSLVLGIASLLAVLLINVHVIILTSFLMAFSITTMLMGIIVAIMPLAQKFLTFQSGVLIRLGVVLFIVARIIELTNG